MKTKYPLYPKPAFKNNDYVKFTLDGSEESECHGYIRGLGLSHLLDHWIIEVIPEHQCKFWNVYPYSSVLIQHTLIYQNE